MSTEKKKLIVTCGTCWKVETNSSREPLMSNEVAHRPWELVGVDLFALKGNDFLIIDRLVSSVMLRLKNHFARHGCPERLISDNCPQFVSL
ncbi:hypothetical protein P5673_026187 [Acropora cervicornis]|uniref:Integrase catalytic domain-containing protein n=1 Tax=Acropora cervicornis TaxID=6130 RepID=A0AAD9Q174_ACRCE|nr:hypothetical protein P5673_026187 [Acropora cervicornis]